MNLLEMAAKDKENFGEEEVDFLREPSKGLGDGDETYYTGGQEKSVALIFNNFSFIKEELNSQRKYAKSDGDKLEKLLENLNFDVRNNMNLNCDEIREEIDADFSPSVQETQCMQLSAGIDPYNPVAKEDHSKRGCLLVMVLTTGSDGKLHAKDLEYDDKIIWRAFNGEAAPTLIGKPKVFFFQSSGTKVHCVPKCPDHFIFRVPTIEKKEYQGSAFVEEFCNLLEKYASSEDLATIMMRVSKNLSEENKLMIMPVVMSTLNKLFVLHQTFTTYN